jgi:hypothetical protein
LPTGGRLLTYVNVSDIVRHNVGSGRCRLDQIDDGVILLDRRLRTGFRSRGAQESGIARTRPRRAAALCGSRRAASQNAVYRFHRTARPFVDKRIDWVKRGDPGPQELRMSTEKSCM